jgi:hypothetical protein
MIYSLTKNKVLNEVSDFFTNSYIVNFKDPGIFKKILFLKCLEDNKIVVIAFCKPESNVGLELSEDHFKKDIKKGFIANTYTLSFRLLSLNSEIYQPKIGDYVTIWEYLYKTNNINTAVKSFNETIYPLLQDEIQTRKSYLLYQKNNNVYTGITMLSERKDDLNVMEKKMNLLNLYFDKAPDVKTFRILKVE